MKTAITQYAYTTGKVASSVYGRNDVKPLESAVKEAQNVLPIEQGPLIGRTGTVFIAPAKYANKVTRLVEFRFSIDQALVLEVGDLYIRFFINGAQVTSGGVPYEVVTPFTEAMVDELCFSGTGDIVIITHGSLPPHKLSRYANNNWTLTLSQFNNGPFMSTNLDLSKKVYLTSAYDPARLIAGDIVTVVPVSGTSPNIFNDAVKFENLMGRLFMIQVPATNLGDGGYALIRITDIISPSSVKGILLNTPDAVVPSGGTSVVQRLLATTGRSTWRLGSFSGQYYSDTYIVSATASANGTYTPVWTLAPIGSDDRTSAWLRSDATMDADRTHILSGYYLKYKNSGNWWALCFAKTVGGTTTHTTLFHMSGGHGSGSITPPTTWGYDFIITRVDASTKYKTDSWPSLSVFHQQRLVYAASLTERGTMWFSEIADHDSFMPINEQNEVLDDSGMAYTLSGGTSDSIAWMLSGMQLFVGTIGDEYVSATSSDTAPITPSDISFVRQSSRGSATNQTPVLVGGTAVFVQRLGAIVRGLNFDLTTSRYKGVDLTKLCDDILSVGGGFKSVTFSPEPSSVLYFVTQNGGVATLTYEEQDAVIAWANIVLGGSSPKVKSMCTVPSTIGNYFDTYYLVERVIDGATVRYIEMGAKKESDPNYWNYLDCSLTYHSLDTPIGVASGLEHLEGETVTVIADRVVSTGTVVDGEVECAKPTQTLPAAMTNVQYVIISGLLNGYNGKYVYDADLSIEERTYTNGPYMLHGTPGNLRILGGEDFPQFYKQEAGVWYYDQDWSNEIYEVVSPQPVLTYGMMSNHVIVGYPFRCLVQLLPIEGQLPGAGSTYGKAKRTIGLSVQTLNSLDIKIGKSLGALDSLNMDSEADLNSGVYNILVNEDWELSAGDLYIVHDAPTPFSLVTTTREVEFRD